MEPLPPRVTPPPPHPSPTIPADTIVGHRGDSPPPVQAASGGGDALLAATAPAAAAAATATAARCRHILIPSTYHGPPPLRLPLLPRTRRCADGGKSMHTPAVHVVAQRERRPRGRGGVRGPRACPGRGTMVPPAGRRLVAPADVSRGECRGAGRREEVGEAVGQGPTLLPDARWGVRRRLPDTTRPPPRLSQRVGPGRHCGGGDTRRAVGGAEVVLAAGAAAALAGRIDKGGRWPRCSSASLNPAPLIRLTRTRPSRPRPTGCSPPSTPSPLLPSARPPFSS